MAFGVAVVGLDSAGGPQLGGGQAFVKIGGAIVVLLGDPVAGHGEPPHSAPVMVQGSGFIKIGGIPVVIQGNLASCGHPSTGRPWITASG